ncbi:MAG: bacteriohemerythrin [Burkholderiales bacterium]
MEWTQDLSVGVEQIDSQHKELIARVNSFFDAMKNGSSDKRVFEMLDFLESYVASHFKDEEALQVRYGYPGYAAHKKLHEDFKATVKNLRKEIEKGFTPATQSMVGMTLTNWLLLHITKEDKALGKYIRSKQ